jgi:hypothetical protein
MSDSRFILLRNRDAWPVIRGYVYQVDMTIEQWISLLQGQSLELERGEDIDLVNEYISCPNEQQEKRLIQQIKHRDENITLKSPYAIEAMASFYEHLKVNPGLDLNFRFLTNAKIGIERPPIPCKIPAIVAWEQLRTDQVKQEEIISRLKQIKNLMCPMDKPEGLSKDTWESWHAYIINSSPEELLNFISHFQWSTNLTPSEEYSQNIKNILEDKFAYDSNKAEEIYQRLFLFIFKLLSKQGIKILSIDILNEQLQLPNLLQSDIDSLRNMQSLFSELENRVNMIESTMSSHSEMLETLYQKIGDKKDVNYLSARSFLNLPPLVERISRRTASVQTYLNIMNDKTWIALLGDIGCGKTHLAILIAESFNTCQAWIRLKALTPEKAYNQIALALLTISQQSLDNIYNQEYISKLCQVIGRDSLIVLDDLPNTLGEGILNDFLIILARECEKYNIKIVSSSPYKLSVQIHQSIGETILYEVETPKFTDTEVIELFISFGAPGNMLNEGFVRLILSLTKGNPLLLSAVATYLSSKNWTFNVEDLDRLLRHEYASDVNTQTHKLLVATVDADTRRLLYRLILVDMSFNYDIIRLLSEIEPPISQPIEKINNILGLWIQKDQEQLFMVSPLLTHLGSPDLSSEETRAIHIELAEYILKSRVLEPFEIFSAISHFHRAGDFDDAGTVLIRALMAFYEQHVNVDRWGITSLWYDLPLPQEMNLNLQLMLRTIQIRVCERIGKNVDYLLNDLDNLLDQSSDNEGAGIISAAFFIGIMRATKDRERANRYILKLISKKDLVSSLYKEEVQPPVPLESLIWLNAYKINRDELPNWILTFEKYSDEQILLAMQGEATENGCLYICDRLWKLEGLKPENEQEWDQVNECLNKISTFAIKRQIELLWACSIRAQVIVSADYRKDFEKALALANDALKIASDDARVQFILREVIGRKYYFNKMYEEAYNWLTRAFDKGTNAYSSEQAEALLVLSLSLGEMDPRGAIQYYNRTIDFCRNQVSIPETYLIKILAEYVTALWIINDLPDAYNFWEEAAERLLACKEDNDDWKSLFVIFGHVSGYLTKISVTGIPPEKTFDGEEYTAPRRGMFLTYLITAATYYNPSREWYLANQLSLFAESVKKYSSASKWALKAFDIAREIGDKKQISLMGYRAIPYLINENKFAETIDLALDTGSLFQAFKIQQELGRLLHDDFEVYEILGTKPNDNWINAEDKASILGPVFILLRIATIKFEDHLKAEILSKEVANICRQIYDSACPDLWSNTTEVFENIFKNKCSFKDLVNQGNDTNYRGLRYIYHIGSSLVASPEYAIQSHLATIPLLYEEIKPYTSLNRLILCPFIKTYWYNTFNRSRFRFSSPRNIEAQLSIDFQVDNEASIKNILKTIAGGLSVKINDSTWKWLNGQ